MLFLEETMKERQSVIMPGYISVMELNIQWKRRIRGYEVGKGLGLFILYGFEDVTLDLLEKELSRILQTVSCRSPISQGSVRNPLISACKII